MLKTSSFPFLISFPKSVVLKVWGHQNPPGGLFKLCFQALDLYSNVCLGDADVAGLRTADLGLTSSSVGRARVVWLLITSPL